MRSIKSIGLSVGVTILQRPYSICLPFFALVIALTWSVKDNFFFWDTIQLASQHAHFFYQNIAFSTFLLPDEMDSGHPPTFGLYLALVWKTFDKTLVVSHLAMLPFLIGIIWQAWKLGEKVVGDGWALLFLLLLIVCPVIAGQAVLVSPDIVLGFFFLMALNGIFKEINDNKLINSNLIKSNNSSFIIHNLSLTISVLGLSMISMRGMMVIFALFIFYCLIKLLYFKKLINSKIIDDELINNQLVNDNYNKNNFSYFNFKKYPLSIKAIFELFLPFSLGICFGIGFLCYHFMQKGWIGFHPNSPWMPAFEKVNAMGFIKNSGILIWRLIDFGHLSLWLICIYGLIKIKKIFPTTRLLIALLIILLLVLSPTLLIYKGLLAHRYLMPVYIVLILLTVKIISDLKNYKRQLTLSFIAFIGLATGNFWVYPQPISTGWDATLAHVPYYALRREMLQFIDNQHISYAEIGTAFPNQRDFETTDLIKMDPSVQNGFSTYNFEKHRFIFYSNIMNEFSDADLIELKTNWHSIKTFKKGQVEVTLFENNNSPSNLRGF